LNAVWSLLREHLPEVLRRYGILIAFAIVVAVASMLHPAFLTRANLLNIVRQSSVHGIMAVGMTFVILTAGIDLSVGSVLALAGVLCASFERAGWPVFHTFAVTMLIGAAIGLVNGLVITKGKVTPFVVTLGTMSIARGFAHIYTGGQPIGGFRDSFRYIGRESILGVHIPILVFLGVLCTAALILRYTRLGRHIYAIGSNEAAARLAGVNIDRGKTAAYVISGLTAAAAAIILTARLNSGESIAGQGYELDVIASVVIGGTSLMGGRGSVWGTLVGALLIGTINNTMNLLLVSSYWQLVVRGLVIVAAVLVDRLRQA